MVKFSVRAYLVFLIAAIGSFFEGLYAGAYVPVSPLFYLAYALVFTMAVVSWLHQDFARRGLRVPWDLDLFICVAWPVVVPVCLFKTRRWRGFLAVFLFVLIVAIASVLGILLGEQLVG